MKRQVSIILIIFNLILSSCDIEQNVQESIAEASDQAATMLADSVTYFQTVFKNNADSLVLKSNDSIINQKIKGLRSSINSTSNYIDSLRKEMSKFGNNVKNIDVIKEVFINKSISDSLFNKLNRSISLAEDIALNPSLKSSVKQIGDNMLLQRNSTEFKNQYFSLNSPDAVTWLLSAFQIELYKAGATSLRTAK